MPPSFRQAAFTTWHQVSCVKRTGQKAANTKRINFQPLAGSVEILFSLSPANSESEFSLSFHVKSVLIGLARAVGGADTVLMALNGVVVSPVSVLIRI
jgi:hypothetical protein